MTTDSPEVTRANGSVFTKTASPASLDTLKVSVPPAVKFAPCEPQSGDLRQGVDHFAKFVNVERFR